MADLTKDDEAKQGSLSVATTFGAILRGQELALLRQLPDWPGAQTLTEIQRPLAARLKRLGVIKVRQCEGQPLAGVTALGRASQDSGIVKL